MVRQRIEEAAEAMHGTVVSGRADAEFEGIALDSRRVRGGELFFALPGEHTDGHRFVEAALDAGAAAAVVSQSQRESPSFPGLIEVRDTTEALHALTRWVRQQLPTRLIGVTGSAGKTTTKEFLACLLGARFRVAASPGNLNNLFGFPIALLGIADDTEWMVAEMGMSTPGELGRVSRLGRPDIVVLTNIRLVHLEGFEVDGQRGREALETIAEAKAEIFGGLAASGAIIANAADTQVRRIVQRESAARPDLEVRWFGQGPVEGVFAWAEEIEERNGRLTFELCCHAHGARGQGHSVSIALPLHGRVQVENFLAAATCALHLGVTLDDIAGLAETFEASPRRGVVHHLPGDITLIDDSYNANPDATAQALDALVTLPGERHWAVLGDMLELGSLSRSCHQSLGEKAAGLLLRVVGVGAESRRLVDAAQAQGAEACWFPDAAAAAASIPSQLQPGDVVLVKGSRGVGLDVLVDRLLASASDPAANEGAESA